MKRSTKTFVLALVTAVMVGIPCMAQDESRSSWKRLPDMAVLRWEARSIVFENKLYVFGGYKMPTKACKRVDVFDPQPLSAAAAGIIDGKLYLAGGSPNGATPQPGMWVRRVPDH